jgi:O-antigen/teichoic acid export membrane protein
MGLLMQLITFMKNQLMISKIKSKISTNLFRNFFKYSFGTLFEKMILMIIFFYVANLFGPEKYGELAYSLSILTLFSVLSVLGLDAYGHKEVSKDRDKVSLVVTNHTIFKIFLFFIVELILYFYTSLFEESSNIKQLIMLYSLVIFFDIFNMEWVARSLEKYEVVVLSKVISSVVFIISIFLLLNQKSSNLEFILIFVFLYKLLTTMIYIIKFKQYISLEKISFKYIKTALLPSITLMASFFMMTVYYHIDKIMLGNFHDKSYVGMYDVAYKIFGIFTILNTLLWNVFSSRISRKTNIKEYKLVMISSGVFLSSLLYLSGDLILESFFESTYLEISIILKIFAFNIFIIFLNSTYVSPLMLWGKEKLFFYLTMLGAILNILLNILLIPSFTMQGAAIATVSSEVIILFTFYFINLYGKNDL